MSHASGRVLRYVAILITVLFLGACAAEPPADPPAPPTPAAPQDSTPEPEPEPTPEPAFDTLKHSIDDPSSMWVVVNKLRPLSPAQYAPEDLVFPEGIENANGQPLRAEAADAAVRLVQAAEADGVWFRLGSAYRDYSRQEYLYTSYTLRDGQSLADTYSARPGHSEHQTGLTADFDDGGSCYLWACFADTAAGLWLAEHAPTYGWILRYPEGYDDITGYTFEPWHFRYVGEELALEMQHQGVLTLEEFFGLPHAPDYAR